MNENGELKKRIDELLSNQSPIRAINTSQQNRSISVRSYANQSILNQSGQSSIADFSMNQSMTSEVAMARLEDNLRGLSAINEKLE